LPKNAAKNDPKIGKIDPGPPKNRQSLPKQKKIECENIGKKRPKKIEVTKKNTQKIIDHYQKQ
jgi:hypothetical protein